MDTKDIRKRSESDLVKQLAELRGQVRELRFKIYGKELKNHQQLKQVRKDIARILTILREKSPK